MARTKTKEREPALFETEPKPAEAQLAPPKPEAAAPAKPPAKRAPKAEKKGEVVKFEPPQQNVLAIIADAARNPAVDAPKARELFQLYLDTEAKQQFHDALMAIDFPAINRDGKIPVSGGKALRFASFENVHKAVVPLLKKAGFRMSFQPMPASSGEGMVVECKLIRGIYEEKCIVPISTAPASRAMNSQQAIGAAIKYASRYGMMYLLNLYSEAPEDRDTDGNPPKIKDKGGKDEDALHRDADPKITDKQAMDLRDKIEACGVDSKVFCQKYEIEKVADLPARQLQEAIGACDDYKKRADAAAKR